MSEESSELNLGKDWEQSKTLVAHWHNKWAKERMTHDNWRSMTQLMIDFAKLSADDKERILLMMDGCLYRQHFINPRESK